MKNVWTRVLFDVLFIKKMVPYLQKIMFMHTFDEENSWWFTKKMTMRTWIVWSFNSNSKYLNIFHYFFVININDFAALYTEVDTVLYIDPCISPVHTVYSLYTGEKMIHVCSVYRKKGESCMQRYNFCTNIVPCLCTVKCLNLW